MDVRLFVDDRGSCDQHGGQVVGGVVRVQHPRFLVHQFPEIVFQLTLAEAQRSRSQIATLKRGQNIKYLPYAFTEHGAIMAATVLNSPQAVKMTMRTLHKVCASPEDLWTAV
ncbi:MAG: ORF6N domain-containing protein, partial [Lentisphaerae bacterium]|nr:ORF6N domain-containing protein [Lentisphaerota bacterium]